MKPAANNASRPDVRRLPHGANALRLRITLAEIEPAPCRVVDVPASLSLVGLHDVIQAAFGWWDYHLWEFQVAGVRVAVPDPEDADYPDRRPFADARRFPVARCWRWGLEEAEYLYDFGDHWVHTVRFESAFRADDPDALPDLVEGAWAAPREDSGGPFGFAEFKEAVGDPLHEEREELLAWYGGPFDPADIREAGIRAALAQFRAYRADQRRRAKQAWVTRRSRSG